jgi:hypothetical protein
MFKMITLGGNAILQSFNERLAYIREIFQVAKVIA